MTIFRYTLAVCTAVFLLDAPYGMAQQDDPYLKAIQEENKKLENLAAARQEESAIKSTILSKQGGKSYLEEIENESAKLAKTASTGATSTAGTALPTNKDEASMEQVLASEYPASYKLYEAMNENDKNKIRNIYINLADKDPIVRNAVLVQEIIQSSIGR